MAASSIVSPVMNNQTRGEITDPNFGETSKAKNEEKNSNHSRNNKRHKYEFMKVMNIAYK
jgi:hypothetical protein